MSSSRSRLFMLVVLALVAGTASQSAGARSGATASPLSRLVALSHTLGARGMPAFGAESAQSAISARRTASSFGLLPSAGFAPDAVVFSATWADYDSDGKLDVLEIGCVDTDCDTPVTRLYHNSGNGTFSEDKASGLPAVFAGAASWADYDSDGNIDVVISGLDPSAITTTLARTTGVTRLYHNNGDGTFVQDTSANLTGVETFIYGTSLSWADYDNDGRPDLLVSGISGLGVDAAVPAAPTTVVTLYRNNGDGTFSEDARAGLPKLLATSVTWADYDADGRQDLLLRGVNVNELFGVNASTVEAPVTKLLHNNGDGSFSEDTSSGLANLTGDWTSWGDFDGDGVPDVLISGADPTTGDTLTELFHNNGDGSFSEDKSSGLPNVNDVQFVSGDFNSDGRLDLMFNGCFEDCSPTGYTTELYDNNGNGTFSEDANALFPDLYAWLVPGDFNGDGRLDMLMYAEFDAGELGLFQNNGSAADSPPAVPTGLRAHLTAKRQLTFSWDPDSSAGIGITYNLRIGTKPGRSDIVSPLAENDGTRQLAQYGNAGDRTFATVKIPWKDTYYWSVQAIGADFAGSAFAPEKTFTIAPGISIKLAGATVHSCAAPATVTGKVTPPFAPGSVVVLQGRPGLHSHWKKLARATTDSQGAYNFTGVGKGSKTSFWVRTVSNSLIAIRLVSAPKHVTGSGACGK